jgi:hypothetical protein
MSNLIICSNELSTTTGISEFQSPFSFSNHLQQPLRIPKNSEIAVQSLKIVKDGSITLNPSSRWYGYYGVKPLVVDLNATTSVPIPTGFDIDRTVSSSVADTALQLQTGINNGVPNPETFGMNTVSVSRDTDEVFDGFKYEFKARGSGASDNNLPTTWVNNYSRGGIDYDASNQKLKALTLGSSKDKVFNIAIGTDHPIALNNGEYIMGIGDANNTSWAVGLTRSRAVGKNPDYLNEETSKMSQNKNMFGDFIVSAVQTDKTSRHIRIFHAVYDTTDAGYDDNKPMSMEEIPYWTNPSSDLAGAEPYVWSTNTANYDKIKMVVKNEKISVYINDPVKGLQLLLPDTGAKGTIFKPVADTCRCLYPMAFISSFQAGTPATERFLTLEKFSGRNIGMKYGITDWWGYLSSNDLEITNAKPVDTRPYNDMGGGISHVYKGLNASGYPDYNFVMIVLPDDGGKYKPTEDANADLVMGFENKAVIDTYDSTNASGGGVFTSVSTPELKSTTNVFVRLNNFNITTYNAGRSSFSKIIYSAPRFSSGTDQSVGSLFLESPEKTYISLNNPDEIVANTFDIDLVNEDETLATDLLGKTVVLLHVRPLRV